MEVTAMENLRKILGRRIADTRKSLKLTQTDLANEIGVSSPQIISQIEQGKRGVDAWELAKLAKLLRTTTNALLDIKEPEPLPEVLWRKLPDQEEIKKADFLKHCREYHELEQLNDVEAAEIFPSEKIDFEKADYRDIAKLAERISREFSLGSIPAALLEKTLEGRYGVKVWYMDLGQDGSAAATIGSFGPAILMNSREAPWRRNYNFAHEVFHLLTWCSHKPQTLRKDEKLWQTVERFAEVFASCLLLPGDSLIIAFDKRIKEGTINYTDLIEIAREFDVSTRALLYRLQNLRRLTKKIVDGLLADSQFREMDKATMGKSWWSPPEFPERFVRLAYIAYKKGKITRSRLASYLNSSLIDLDDLLKEYGLNDREDSKIKVRNS
jgi:Zn-dependent peptidase ImmA (M78 family)/DNA-binding XRE family transcriptional regulator